jgi:hypothetical protein
MKQMHIFSSVRRFQILVLFRDRPFNLKGGLWFIVSFRNFFSDNTRVRIFIFLSRKAQIFFQEFLAVGSPFIEEGGKMP